jgi:hypothetical protein
MLNSLGWVGNSWLASAGLVSLGTVTMLIGWEARARGVSIAELLSKVDPPPWVAPNRATVPRP